MPTQGIPPSRTMRDLGLSYDQAAHALQSVKAYDLAHGDRIFEPKYMRTGIDAGKAEMRGLAELLIAKGVFTSEEYIEYMRLGMNEEVAWEQDRHPGITFG